MQNLISLSQKIHLLCTFEYYEYGDLIQRRNSNDFKIQFCEGGLSIDECMDELKNVLTDDYPHQTTMFVGIESFNAEIFLLTTCHVQAVRLI